MKLPSLLDIQCSIPVASERSRSSRADQRYPITHLYTDGTTTAPSPPKPKSSLSQRGTPSYEPLHPKPASTYSTTRRISEIPIELVTTLIQTPPYFLYKSPNPAWLGLPNELPYVFMMYSKPKGESHFFFLIGALTPFFAYISMLINEAKLLTVKLIFQIFPLTDCKYYQLLGFLTPLVQFAL